jgi:chromosome segregation ATPase
MATKEKPADGIAQALDRMKQHSKSLEAAHAAAKPIADAIAKCHGKVRERDAAKASLADATTKLQAMLADEVLGKVDQAQLKAARADAAAAKQQLNEAEESAAAHEAALVELQKRYAQANAPIISMAKEAPGLRVEVLKQAAIVLREQYLSEVNDVLDTYGELLALVERINTVSRPHGLPLAQPASVADAGMQFPGVMLPNDPDASWKLSNPGWLGESRMRAARRRLDEKLKELGVAGV